jgi:hypothetical protein
MHTEFYLENLKGRHHLRVLGANGRIGTAGMKLKIKETSI